MRYWLAALTERFGMLIPPNWLAMAGFAMLGAWHNPGWFAFGAALELAYLGLFAASPRFRRAIDARDLPPLPDWNAQRNGLLVALSDGDRARQVALEERAREAATILAKAGADVGQAAALAQLCWVHARLLTARSGLSQVETAGNAARHDLAARIRELEHQIAHAQDDLRASLESQRDTIRARLAAHAEAATKLALVDAEIERIRQQVEHAREQALLSSDPTALARTAADLGRSLGEAARWTDEQRSILGGVDDLLTPGADYLIRQEQRT